MRVRKTEVTYAYAHANLDKLCDLVLAEQRVVMIRREDKTRVALISAQELSSLEETLHLLGSPKNALRLLTALNRAKSHPSRKS
jgi:antitoxin YefM